MGKQLEFSDAKAKRKFKSSDWRIEKRTTSRGTTYFAVAQAPSSGAEVRVRVPLSVAEPHLMRETRRSGKYDFATLVGVKDPSLVTLIDKINDGLPYRTFEQLASLLDTPAVGLAEHLRIPARTLQRRKRTGTLSTDESERLLRVSRIYQAALDFFEGDHKAAVAWLGRRNRGLAERTPLEMSTTELGGEEVLHLIGRLEHGVYS